MPVLLYVLAVAVLAQGTSEFVLAGLVPGISADLGITIAQAGYLTSGFAVGMVVGAPLTAALGRRLPPRWTLTGCLLVFVVAHAASALTDQFAVLLVSRFVAALANAGFLAVALSTVTAVVPAPKQARALAAILGGTTLATLGPREPGVRTDLRAELGTLRSPGLRHSLTLGVLVNGATFCAFTYLAPLVTDGAGLADPHGHLVLGIGVPVLVAGWILWAGLAGSPSAVWVLAPVLGALSFAVGGTLRAAAPRNRPGAPRADRGAALGTLFRPCACCQDRTSPDSRCKAIRPTVAATCVDHSSSGRAGALSGRNCLAIGRPCSTAALGTPFGLRPARTQSS